MKKRNCVFGDVLINTRKLLGISQYELAKRSGLSERHLNYLEHGRREPRPTTIIQIAHALGIKPGAMLDDMARRMADADVSVP